MYPTNPQIYYEGDSEIFNLATDVCFDDEDSYKLASIYKKNRLNDEIGPKLK